MTVGLARSDCTSFAPLTAARKDCRSRATAGCFAVSAIPVVSLVSADWRAVTGFWPVEAVVPL